MAEAQVSTSLVAAPSLATQVSATQTFPAQNVQNIPQIGPSGQSVQNLSQSTSSVLWTILSAAGILALILAALAFVVNMIKPQALPVWIPLPHARESSVMEEAEEAADSDASDGEESQQKKPRKRPAQNKGKGPASKKPVEEKKEESGAEAESEINTGLFTEFPDAAA